MNPTVKKWLIKPLIILTLTLAVLGAIGYIVLLTQQERFVNLAVQELNKQLKGELTIDESSISLFKNFPQVSVVLHGGKFFANKSTTEEPIYEFDRLYVGFSLPELLKQNYHIKKLFVEGGYLDLVEEKDGSINVVEATHVNSDSTTGQPSASGSTSKVVVDLEAIVMTEMNISFLDKASGNKVSTRVDELTSSLKIDSSTLTVVLYSDMMLDLALDSGTMLLQDKRFQIDLSADYKLDASKLEIASCNIKFEDAGFNVGGFADLADTTEIELYVEGEGKDFNLFRAFLPADVKEDLKPFQYDGRLHFNALVIGKVDEKHQPLVEVRFKCEDAWFLNTAANKKVDQLGFRGLYTNGSEHSLQTSELHMLSLSARPEKGTFKADFVIRDFTAPKIVAKVNSELELKFLGEFLGIPDLKQMTGNIKLDMNFKELHDIVLPEESLNKLKEGIQSNLIVRDLSFRIPGYPHAVRDMNVHAEMKDGRVTVDSASFKIGNSDLKVSGFVSDVRRFLRDRDKPVRLALNASSKQMVLSNLLSYDTALARAWNEEVHGFNINLALETTVNELLNPSPLPRGTFEMKNLRGTFKNYAHTFKDLGATVMVNDTLLRVRDFTGMIDSSDINFKGRIINYHLWFDNIKKGKTQIAFDFKSNRFALRDVFTKNVRSYLPHGYRREELDNVWLRAKIDLRYDTTFRFAKAKVANVSADLRRHKLKLHEISGGVKYGSKILSFDTLRGKIGNSDFDINLKYYFKGIDRYNNKVSNSLTFNSKLIDADEISQYDLAPSQKKVQKDSVGRRVVVAAKPDSSHHAKAFNVFMIPFSDFNAQINIGKLKYNKLWLKEVNTKISMRQDQTITIDTLMMKVAGGSVAMSGKFNGTNHKKIFFKSLIIFDQVDLEKMMVKLDHFGQDIVVNKNVKGRISGRIDSYVRVHPDLVPMMSNTKAEIALNIYNGSLVDFAPMHAMASYFKDKNLRHIRFDTLRNNLRFNNGVLIIPAMHINSSLGYIQVSGRQSLDLQMEYYLRVPMKMVTKVGFTALFNRKQEEVDLNQIDEIEYIDKDKKIGFMNLKLTGTPSNFQVGLGKDKKKGRKI